MDYPESYRLTFCGLLGAFMELAFAYCLLCVSAFVFITSKLLLFLPCPCSGILGYQNSDLCIQKLLFDWPFRIILRVQKLTTTTRLSLLHHQEDQEEKNNLVDKDKNLELIDKVRLLEEALEEERVARAALMVELEEERAASASAADEAMAMILRLQADKASLEMEGKQYERMIDEKFAYDEEEMNILKEILFKREREKHFLEKELETYKHIDDDQETEDDGFNEKREGDEDREPIMYDVHVIEDNSNAKVRDDDVAEHKEMTQMEDEVKQLLVKDHDSESSPTSSSIHLP
ncbi:GTD-binding domain [Arabidopsis thaliana x Arabidopsis arenosa]|uniref:GTD-binding domain n=1 Tax=Arabidopsis thaliana x Arabidopsis arenosa TaxID=1240361 RepID=A0A8T1Y7S8_9BRAS|nr:GTD-binding domain [Arabidopsis thaliana x Arabidopsis arenosa]